ncbi:efflux RND transporter permease subunit [Burkholderia gladioli]|uniref:efflux RND transporter permease subunit n=1 Tax=Burkholderia gladioli TaxID=28095 RepID=UPI00163F36AE|nr:efflux RND transporter permease subunit [Burkholderia gladioli]
MSTPRLGLSGRIAAFFLQHRITPLVALVALLLGVFAMVMTPREEEPQINVTMANVLVPFPGASARDVEQMVAGPAEQVLSQINGIEHVMSVSRPGLAVLTVQFKVGVPRTEALVRLYDTVFSNQDWLPRNLGVLPPLIKPKGIDDVPIVVLTLYGTRPDANAFDLERVGHSIEAELKRVPGTREVTTMGGPQRAVNVLLDPARMRAAGVTIDDLRRVLATANAGASVGDLVRDDRAIHVESGPVLADARDVGNVIVAVHDGHPVSVDDVADVRDGAPAPTRYVWEGLAGAHPAEYPAISVTVTKKPGENAVAVARNVLKRVDTLRNTVIPGDVRIEVARDYGVTANAKALKLIEKLAFATTSVVVLVLVALGWREALVVGLAVVLTLTATLFASWAWGFTLNRVSLFALILAIGILVDDAIVVVENIHRHHLLEPEAPVASVIPRAVDEVGGPTTLATLTVIAALLPMAFVTGLMGPYMSPIPINASMGMAISLSVAFVVTPWLSRIWLAQARPNAKGGLHAKLEPLFGRVFAPFLDDTTGARRRNLLWLGIAGAIALSLTLPVFQWVVLKMLPFDNKSEFQVVVDMPAGTPLERTAAVLHEMGAYLASVPEVSTYQAYAGLSAPINFNGLVRQYYLRAGGNVGDIQVNLVGQSGRRRQSHAIATAVRPALEHIAERSGARVKVVEVPPGPPVLAPIVAEVYGTGTDERNRVAREVRHVFSTTRGVVDIDDSTVAAAPQRDFDLDRRKAGLRGVSQADVASTLRAGLTGDDVTYLHDGSKYPAAVRLVLPATLDGDASALLALAVRGSDGQLIPLSELVRERNSRIEQPIYHKDLLPVTYVVGDMAGRIDSPLYGMFEMRGRLSKLATPGGSPLGEWFIRQPDDPYRSFAIKWDGEWQVTYETFRDMGTAYAVGLVLIYLLVVAEFGSYLTPLIIMAPIPLTIIGVMPGHALLGAQFTATSMIGMIALAGIIVRNSILLVDFVNLQVADGVPFKDAIVRSAATRAQPILLTAFAAMIGAFFILDDPIFNGLAVSLIFGILVSTLLTLVVIPLLYYTAYRQRPLAVHR